MHLGKRIVLAFIVAASAATVRAAPAPREPVATAAPTAQAPEAGGTAAGADLALLFGGLGAIGFVTLRRGRSEG